jgi:hypothetical protein
MRLINRDFEAQVLAGLDTTPRNTREICHRIRQARTASKARGAIRTIRVLDVLTRMHADGKIGARRAENQELRFARG